MPHHESVPRRLTGKTTMTMTTPQPLIDELDDLQLPRRPPLLVPL
jgi:hypothetical protein